MRSDRQGRAAQVIAWAWVVVVHAGLFWLLGLHERSGEQASNEARMRLVFLPRREPLPAPSPRPPASTAPPRLQVLPGPAAPPAATAGPTPATPTTGITAAIDTRLREPGAAWTHDAVPQPSFAPDPLRDRRAQLPGGERPETFRQRDPIAPADVVGFIGMLFGDPGPPCPRIKRNLAHLSAATSDHDRELLEEEFRRDQKYCRP